MNSKHVLHVLPGYVTRNLYPKERRMDLIPVYITITLETKDKGDCLSISGVTGPKSNGDAYGSCGQNIEDLIEARENPNRDQGWTMFTIDRLVDIWKRWHLNDMRTGCAHQRASWDTSKEIEIVSYGLTTEAYHKRVKAISYAAHLLINGGSASQLTPEAKALIALDDWYADRRDPPNADSPLSGCFEVKKREKKSAGWVTQNEHRDGLLGKPCEVCGYRYGSAWLFEKVPDDVIEWLFALPEANPMMPVVWK